MSAPAGEFEVAASRPGFAFRLQCWLGRAFLHALVNAQLAAVWCARTIGLHPRPLKPGVGRRILLTGTFYSENWIMNHLRPLAASAMCEQVWIVCDHPIPPTPKITQLHPPRWLARLAGATPSRLLTFSWLAARRRPDFIGGFHLLVNGLLAAVLARWLRRRAIYFCGGGAREVEGGGFCCGNRLFQLLGAPDSAMERKLTRAINGCDLVITMGRGAAQHFQAQGVTSRFEVVPGGIDVRRFARTENASRSYDLILVAHLTPVKRVDLFLQTVRELSRDLPEVRAVIVGSGEREEFYRNLARELGVAEHVHFAGFQRDVLPWLHQSKVFVLTSKSEGLSLAMMEALAAGLPCVVSDVGELGELIEDGVNGRLVRNQTAEGFAAALRPLLRDEKLWQQQSRAALASARQVDSAESTRRWDAILGLRTMTRSGSHQIEVVRGAAALAGLREEWNELWRECPEATEAQTWTWQQLYWQHVAHRQQCLVVTARDGAGRLDAAAVFEIRRDRRSLLNVLSFSGEHDADYHVILRRPETPLSVGTEMFAMLVRAAGPEVACLEFINLPRDSWTAEALRLAVPDLGCFAETGLRRESETYAITLPATMDEYWARFSKKTRDRLKGKQRKFLREMQTEFRVTTDASRANALLDEIEVVDRSRWGAATKFSDARQRAFLRGMITELLAAGVARVFTLHANGRCVAFNVGFLLRGSMKFPYLAHDTSLPGNYSVGLINNLFAIGHCIQHGVREYDLTRGSEGYKSLLGGDVRHNVQCVFWRDEAHRVLGAFNRDFVAPLLRNKIARRIYRAAVLKA